MTAAAAVVTYVERTQFGKKPNLAPPAREAANSVLMIDAATRANLELMRTLSGAFEGSLLATIDRTKTTGGARLLARRLASPLLDPDAINARLDLVDYFATNSALRSDVRAVLAGAPDLSRSLARLSLGRGGPRDLAAVRDALAAAQTLAEMFGKAKNIPLELTEASNRGRSHTQLDDQSTRRVTPP